jgi:glutamate 5-kinase
MRTSRPTILVREEIRNLRTLVVKVGSRIVSGGGPVECRRRLSSLAADIARLGAAGVRVVLVSSGAIARGMEALGLDKRPATIPLKQACASIGQSRLMEMYEGFFREHRIVVGQVLLTWDDLRDKKRFLNLRNTLFQLLDHRALPVVNENDSVGIDEIRFGDNDTLGAQIAMLVNADVYVILTDINGLYDADPKTVPDARHIPLVPRMSHAMHRLAAGNSSEISVGGMITKLRAAEQVMRSGAFALIGNGYERVLMQVLSDPAAATLFLPSEKKLNARGRWIAYAGRPRGSVTVDDGARRALVERGTSLLPAGVRRVDGAFKAGDTVDILDSVGAVVARGLINYSSDEAAKIKGVRTTEIEKLLGQKLFDELIHRDNMVVL